MCRCKYNQFSKFKSFDYTIITGCYLLFCEGQSMCLNTFLVQQALGKKPSVEMIPITGCCYCLTFFLVITEESGNGGVTEWLVTECVVEISSPS